MPIYHNHKAIHVHIPKSAGTTIMVPMMGDREDIVRKGIANYEYLFGNEIYKGGMGRPLQHMTIKEIMTRVDDDIFNSYFKFSVVRNPWDRMVSEFFWQKQHSLANPVTLDDFLESFLTERSKEEYNTMDSDDSHRIPAYNFLHVDGNLSVDKVFRYENIERDIKEISDMFGIEMKERWNSSPRGKMSYRFFYNDFTRDLVEWHFEKDIETWDYEF